MFYSLIRGGSCNTSYRLCAFFLTWSQDIDERKNHLAFIASSYHCSQVGHLSAWTLESDDEVDRDLLSFASERDILTIAAAAPRKSTVMRAITNI